MPATRKCYIPRSNNTRSVALKRRKLMQEYIEFNKSALKVALNELKKAEKEVKNVPVMRNNPLGKALMKMADPSSLRKMARYASLIQQQILRLPAMSKEQETKLYKEFSTILNKSKQKMKIMHLNTESAVKADNLPTNLFSETQMPDLFVGTSECAWEAGSDVMPLYNTRIATNQSLQSFLKTKLKSLSGPSVIPNEIQEILDNFLDIFQTLPPGPTQESEKERIQYMEFMKSYLTTVFQVLELMKKEMEKLMKDLK